MVVKNRKRVKKNEFTVAIVHLKEDSYFEVGLTSGPRRARGLFWSRGGGGAASSLTRSKNKKLSVVFSPGFVVLSSTFREEFRRDMKVDAAARRRCELEEEKR